MTRNVQLSSPTPAMNELDAARECVMAVGLRRTTFSDVARRAGLSRMTLYSRHPDLQSILAALMKRDLGSIIESAVAQAADLPTARERLVDSLVHAVEALSSNTLLLRILEVDPELLLPYAIDRIGQTQRAVLTAMERYVRLGHDDGSIRAGDPAAIAACLELSARGFVFSAGASERACDPACAVAELRAMVDAYLTPVAG